MSRLTCKYDGINVLRELCTFDRESDIEADDCHSCEEYCKRHCDYSCKDCAMQKAFDKLAEYEDLEEQGLLLKLPCKIGDTVYSIEVYEVEEFVVTHFDICKDSIRVYHKYIYIGEMGNSVFATKEEAEQALKRLECAE